MGSELGGECIADSDCTKGKNGRCSYAVNLTAVCTYDECAQDSDCGSGVCACRVDAYANANICQRGNCVTDGDCGANNYCSPSALSLFNNCRSNVPAGSVGYFCHAAADECTDDADCGEQSSCLFFADAKHWRCLPKRCTRGGGGE